MHESWAIDGVRRGLVVGGAVFGMVALLGAGVASAADPVQLRSRLGNWCLDGPTANAAAMVNACDGSKSQLWNLNASSQIESVAFPGNCVTVGTAADNTPAVLAPCQDMNNAHWNRQPNGNITSALDPFPCLNVFGGVAQPATPVIAYHCIPNVEDEEWDSVP